MSIQSIKLYKFYCHVLKSTDVWTNDLSSRQKINGYSFSNFHGKTWVAFCLNTGKHFALKPIKGA